MWHFVNLEWNRMFTPSLFDSKSMVWPGLMCEGEQMGFICWRCGSLHTPSSFGGPTLTPVNFAFKKTEKRGGVEETMPHCHQDNRRRCGESISHHSFRYQYGTETQSSQAALFLSGGLEWILQPDVFMPRRGNFAELRVNVSASPLGLCAGNGRVESVFLCVGSGCGWRVSKSKGSPGNLSGDHPS